MLKINTGGQKHSDTFYHLQPKCNLALIKLNHTGIGSDTTMKWQYSLENETVKTLFHWNQEHCITQFVVLYNKKNHFQFKTHEL